MPHNSVTRCVACEARPVIIAAFMPLYAERMLFGKFQDNEMVQIDYGICDRHKYLTRGEIRLLLLRMAEDGKLELR